MSEASEDPPPRAERTSDRSGDSREGNDVGDLYRAFDESQSTARKIRKAFRLSVVVIIVLIVLSPCAFVGFISLNCAGVIR